MKIKTIAITKDKTLIAALKESALLKNNKMELAGIFSVSGEICRNDSEVCIADMECIDRESELEQLMETIVPERTVLIGRIDMQAGELEKILEMNPGGYISRPIDPGRFEKVLKRISRNIRRVNDADISVEAEASMQSLFFWEILKRNDNAINDISFLNSMMGTRFQSGLYRAMLFKLNQEDGSVPDLSGTSYFRDIKYIQKVIKAETNERLFEYCHDMIFDFQYNGVVAIINYDDEYEKQIREGLEQVRAAACEYGEKNFGMNVTLCVGNAYPDIKKLRKSKDEAIEADWSGIHAGSGKTIFYEKFPEIPAQYSKKIEDFRKRLSECIDTNNFEEFSTCLDDFFKIPEKILIDCSLKEILSDLTDRFFEKNKNLLSAYMHVASECRIIKNEMDFSGSLSDLKDNFKESFAWLFELVGEAEEKNNIRPLRKTVKYIKDHYNESITLEKLAERASLNPVYFSTYFRKHTGKTVSDYILEYRMEQAKKLLKSSDVRINAVAEAVGYSDQRYFASKFKKITGMTPSEYRKYS